MTIAVFIRYEIDPFNTAAFEQYAPNWGQAIPRRGADLIGYCALHEGSSTIAYGVHNIGSLAACETYRARLAADPAGRENYEFARTENFCAGKIACSCAWPRRPMRRWFGRDRRHIVGVARSARQRFASRGLRTAFPRKRVRPCTQTRPDFIDERPRPYR